MLSKPKTRTIPMRKPRGHQPGSQRYSSRVPKEVVEFQVSIFGIQTDKESKKTRSGFIELIQRFCQTNAAPLHREFATFDDKQGYTNIFVICYWRDSNKCDLWRAQLNIWLRSKNIIEMEEGYWLESFDVPIDYRETIAFSDYLRGLTACPHSHLEPIEESGYWGSARDRLAASGYDELATDHKELQFQKGRNTKGQHVKISDIPQYLCIVRSGVSWADCEEEQLNSYQSNLKPKLDAGMEFLRQNPEESGCCSLRQVECLTDNGTKTKEAFSLGIFLSLGHLEKWSEYHPSHLAIYTQALAERRKFQERLQLKTFHEVFILQDKVSFEYLNCHPQTGLLPYFSIDIVK